MLTAKQIQDCLEAHEKALEEMIDARLLEQRIQFELALARIQRPAADPTAVAELGYMTPTGTCTECGRSYKVLKHKGKRRLHANECLWVKPRHDLPYGFLCPSCKAQMLGTRSQEAPHTPTPQELALELNPLQYRSFQLLEVAATPGAVSAGLHMQQAGNDALTEQERRRVEESRKLQVAQHATLMRRLTLKGEVLDWCMNNLDAKERLGDLLLEGARVVILDGTNPKQAARDRYAVVTAIVEMLNKKATKPAEMMASPLPPKPKTKKRHGKQRVYREVEPGSVSPMPDQVALLNAVCDEHATSTVYHSVIVDPGTAAPVPITQAVIADTIATAVGQQLYQVPKPRALTTVLGDQIDLKSALDLPAAARALLIAQQLDHYADEGVAAYSVTYGTEPYLLYITQSVDLQVYVLLAGGVLGWAVYTETGEGFTLGVRAGPVDSLVGTLSAQDMLVYAEEEREDLAVHVDAILHILEQEA